MKTNNWFIRIDPNIDEFKKEIWGKISGDKKIEYAWDMVIEAMKVRGEKAVEIKKNIDITKEKIKNNFL